MANEVSRRDVAKFAAALAVGTGMSTARSVLAVQSSNPADAADAKNKIPDDFLARAKHSPESFMLSEPVIFALDEDPRGYELVITSARNENGDQVEVRVRSRSVRIFRADPTVDEFTSQGGIYWRFRDKPGRAKLKKTGGSDLIDKHPHLGPIVMVVRDEETVRVYTMEFDFRC